jgi:hypothetical protein
MIVYSLSYWYLSDFLTEFFEKGTLKTFIVFLLASLVSWGVSSAIDFVFPSQAISIFGDTQSIADTPVLNSQK